MVVTCEPGRPARPVATTVTCSEQPGDQLRSLSLKSDFFVQAESCCFKRFPRLPAASGATRLRVQPSVPWFLLLRSGVSRPSSFRGCGSRSRAQARSQWLMGLAVPQHLESSIRPVSPALAGGFLTHCSTSEVLQQRISKPFLSRPLKHVHLAEVSQGGSRRWRVGAQPPQE